MVVESGVLVVLDRIIDVVGKKTSDGGPLVVVLSMGDNDDDILDRSEQSMVDNKAKLVTPMKIE